MGGYWDHGKVSIFLESQSTYQPSQRKTRSEIYFKSHAHSLCLIPTSYCVPCPYSILLVSHFHTQCTTLQADLKFGVEQAVDVVFASFIRKAMDVAVIRQELGEKGKHILIVSKVTTPQKLEVPCGTLTSHAFS